MSDRDPDVGCAVLHKDSEGRTVPCPGDHPVPPPELSEVDQLRADNESLRYQIERARWALGTDEPVNEQLRQAEIRAAVAEREAESYRHQVQALVRAIQQERGLPEEALDGEVFIVAAEPSQATGEAIGRAVDRLLAPKTPMADVPPTLRGPSWPGRPANRASEHGTVQGRCPACGNTRLFLGSGGYVTCPRIDCPEPDAASTLLADPQCPAETEVPRSALRIRCIMPLRHASTHADGGGIRWSDGFTFVPPQERNTDG
ncbi:DUF6085 family protein [Streptomyces griseus]|uniref:DUF6085 family protein n=1 Tax=Streptomyces griseus TaxID=1911 RepID=UPI0037BB38C5